MGSFWQFEKCLQHTTTGIQHTFKYISKYICYTQLSQTSIEPINILHIFEVCSIKMMDKKVGCSHMSFIAIFIILLFSIVDLTHY